MRKVLVIGVGPGNPDQVTIQAIDALNRAAVLFIPDKGAEKAALRELREQICERYIKNKNYSTVGFDIPKRSDAADGYRASVDAWHAKLQTSYQALLQEHLTGDKVGAFLVWGDPALYDSTLRILEKIRTSGFALEYEVIPGISSVQALAAQHRIPLNQIGQPVLITTGRRLEQGFPDDVNDVVVMLDGVQAFKSVASDQIDVYWGAYLGTEYEILISGKLSEVAADIERARSDARAKQGWIMDVYLLRKTEKL